MTLQEYINKVKIKIDEVSPFNEPDEFIVSNQDGSYKDVKPIIPYIKEELPNASKYCLGTLPTSKLSKDIVKAEYEAIISKGVGVIESDSDRSFSQFRLVRVNAKEWERDATSFITAEDAEYLLQQRIYTRGGLAKPVVAYVAEGDILELYSFKEGSDKTTINIWGIDVAKNIEDIKSDIEDFIVLKCAQLVLNIFGRAEAAVMQAEFDNKLK